VYKVLRVAAAKTVGGAYRTFDCGISAEDLVTETLEEFFDSPDGLGWKPSKGTMEQFLTVVLKRRAVDHLRRQGHIAGSLDDEDGAIPEPKVADTTVQKVEYNDLVTKLYDLVGDDQDLRDLIAAADLTTGGYKVNQELGEILGKTPQDIVNLKRRLVNTPGVKELLYGRGKAATKEQRA
jgi:hypothetical protein